MQVNGPQDRLPASSSSPDVKPGTRSANQPSDTAAEGSRGTAPVSDAVSDAVVRVPNAEIGKLAQRLREEPDVRTERVARVAERLATGWYATREAAEQVAAAIVAPPQ